MDENEVNSYQLQVPEPCTEKRDKSVSQRDGKWSF